ncbi:hypothetical protein HKX48_003224 [Thoreauomyces humboldtii]|nr:hypothetical protein HKX48_003224 [Thoreauomyces humboldtii]
MSKLRELSNEGKMADNKLAVEVQHYVAVAFYTCMPSGRSKEVRLLLGRILSDNESQESLQNHITA